MYNYQPNHYFDDIPAQTDESYVYGADHRDRLLLQRPEFLPRFASLGRKVLMHYAGEHYNPHTINIADEFIVRVHIQDLITYRIQHRTPGYDWDYIDHFFRKLVGDIYGLDLKADVQRIEQGIQPPYKGFIHAGNALRN